MDSQPPLPRRPPRGRSRWSGAAGFTLVEVLTGLAVLGVSVGYVAPVVARQVDAAERFRVAADLRAVETAVGLYRLDVGTFPATLHDLVEPSGAAGEDRWKGPYLSRGPAGAGGEGGLETAMGAVVRGDLTCFDRGSGDPAAPCAPGRFLAVRIDGLTAADFEAVNDLLDGAGEPDGAGVGGSRRNGRLRLSGACGAGCAEAGAAAYFLVAPYPPATGGRGVLSRAVAGG